MPHGRAEKSNKTTLVVGANGATGRHLVQQLLDRGQNVKAMVRRPDTLPAAWQTHDRLTILPASILDLSDSDLMEHVQGCCAIASCLGHNLSFKGIFGPPHRLVTEAVRRLCDAAEASSPTQPIRFVLMNTAGNRNRDLAEPVSFAHRGVVLCLRWVLPPHADNEQAADYLRLQIGQQNPAIAWAVVRPDTLTHEPHVTDYEAHPSPTRCALFNPGKTSRINVGHFMAELITHDATWNRWQGQMPVIYNKTSPAP